MQIHKELHRFVIEGPGRGFPLGRRPTGASPPRPARFKLFRSESINEDPELANSVLDDRLFDNINNFGDNQVNVKACSEIASLSSAPLELKLIF